ncbi:MAG: PTS sugar transporter subunit IIC [Candidatus Adiutrix sp.]|jgi:mannose/fructose/N-acetylgalactosamine-specific phosphotransferase system component IIC|nr:PTS sugar transporter subunit IIC [Candidatus Adiutrix sp.]
MIFAAGFLGPILIGAVLNLDKQVFGPFMLNRPLVTGFLIGLFLDELHYGVWMGLSVELLWLATMPLGGQVIPNGGLAVAASLAGWFSSVFTPIGPASTEAGLVLSFMTAPLWAKVFTSIDHVSRRLAPGQVMAAGRALAEGREPRFFARNSLGCVVVFAGATLLPAAAAAANLLLLNHIALMMPKMITVNLGVLFTFVPFVGLLIMAVSLPPRTAPYYLAGMLASLLAISAIWP